MRQVAVIGEQQQAFAGVVEASDGIHADANAMQQIHDRGPALGIADRGDVSLGLVHQQVNVVLGAVQQLAVDANVVNVDVGLGAEFGDDLSVDRDQAPAISFSALRREVIPAAEMIFCRRSEGMYKKVIRK